jgi:hypothetical protein
MFSFTGKVRSKIGPGSIKSGLGGIRTHDKFIHNQSRYYSRSDINLNASIVVANMREYILTEHERSILKNYIENGIKESGIRTLLTRIRKNIETLREDIRLIEMAYSK